MATEEGGASVPASGADALFTLQRTFADTGSWGRLQNLPPSVWARNPDHPCPENEKDVEYVRELCRNSQRWVQGLTEGQMRDALLRLVRDPDPDFRVIDVRYFDYDRHLAYNWNIHHIVRRGVSKRQLPSLLAAARPLAASFAGRRIMLRVCRRFRAFALAFAKAQDEDVGFTLKDGEKFFFGQSGCARMLHCLDKFAGHDEWHAGEFVRFASGRLHDLPLEEAGRREELVSMLSARRLVGVCLVPTDPTSRENQHLLFAPAAAADFAGAAATSRKRKRVLGATSNGGSGAGHSELVCVAASAAHGQVVGLRRTLRWRWLSFPASGCDYDHSVTPPPQPNYSTEDRLILDLGPDNLQLHVWIDDLGDLVGCGHRAYLSTVPSDIHNIARRLLGEMLHCMPDLPCVIVSMTVQYVLGRSDWSDSDSLAGSRLSRHDLGTLLSLCDPPCVPPSYNSSKYCCAGWNPRTWTLADLFTDIEPAARATEDDDWY